MKKLLIAVALVFGVFTSSLFSLEWGGLINNMTSVSTSDFKTSFPVRQSNGAFFWLRSSLNKEKTLNISTEAVYKYNLLFSDKKATFTNVVDLNLLKLSGRWKLGKNNLLLDMGRFLYSDISTAVYSQNSDGLNLRLVNMDWDLGLYAGYTGLLNRLNVSMTEQKEPKREQVYDLCYGYVPLSLSFILTNLGENALGFQASYFLDAAGNNVDKGYFDIVARGPVSNFGSYSASVVVGTERFKNIMLFSNLDFSLYATNDILVSIGAEYASGDHKPLSMFIPITYRPIHNSQSVELGSDVLVPRVTGVFFLNGVCITANERLVTSFSNKGFKVNGLDSNISAVYNVFSDLQLSCVLSAYADFVSKEYNNFSFMLNASFTF